LPTGGTVAKPREVLNTVPGTELFTEEFLRNVQRSFKVYDAIRPTAQVDPNNLGRILNLFNAGGFQQVFNTPAGSSINGVAGNATITISSTNGAWIHTGNITDAAAAGGEVWLEDNSNAPLGPAGLAGNDGDSVSLVAPGGVPLPDTTVVQVNGGAVADVFVLVIQG